MSTITTREAIALADAIQALDGRSRVVRRNNEDHVTVEPYRFGGDLLLALAINRQRCRLIAEAHVHARNALVTRLAGGASIIPADHPAAADFHAEMSRMLGERHEIDLRRVPVAALRLDENPIPPAVLEALLPMLEI
ncbi:MAG: hypothetical protein HZA68_12920 [Rhodovulum sp.]|nr:hypothetical protein [Rhodovulum sp.]